MTPALGFDDYVPASAYRTWRGAGLATSATRQHLVR